MIGPDIPAHLIQGKSTAPPPASEENPEAGPSAASTIGPHIPTNILPNSSHTSRQEEEEEEEDDYAPALPPDLVAARSAGSNEAPPKPRSQGPALPPGMERRRQQVDSDSDDDDYGPRPLPSGAATVEKSGVEQFLEQERRRKKLLDVRTAFRYFTLKLSLNSILLGSI